MRHFLTTFSAAFALLFLASNVPCSAAEATKVGVVNFKQCIEKSKLGKQEQVQFEKMKKQMEEVLGEKEKGFKEVAKKLDDDDYLDSLSHEAQAELKHKARTMNQEYSQQQQQFFQMLQQANFKIMQKLHEEVESVSKDVAKEKGLDLILGEEGVFYFSEKLDISDAIIDAMDRSFKPSEEKKS